MGTGVVTPLVLVVDDDEQVRTWIRTVLEHEGYRVTEAEDGHQAVKVIQCEGPQLVILDMFLPGKDGLETILQLRKEQASVKLLAISGQPISAYDVFTVATAFGADETLGKPFSAEELVQRVKDLLGPLCPRVLG